MTTSKGSGICTYAFPKGVLHWVVRIKSMEGRKGITNRTEIVFVCLC